MRNMWEIKQNMEGNMTIMRFMGNMEITMSMGFVKTSKKKVSKLIVKLGCPKLPRHHTSNF